MCSRKDFMKRLFCIDCKCIFYKWAYSRAPLYWQVSLVYILLGCCGSYGRWLLASWRFRIFALTLHFLRAMTRTCDRVMAKRFMRNSEKKTKDNFNEHKDTTSEHNCCDIEEISQKSVQVNIIWSSCSQHVNIY